MQILERSVEKKKQLEHISRLDKAILKKASKELEYEKRKQMEMKKRVELQKVQRDVMLLEAKRNKIAKM